jgi:hypothetical protein
VSINLEFFGEDAVTVVSFSPNLSSSDLVREIRAVSRQVSGLKGVAFRRVFRIYDFSGVSLLEMHMVLLVMEESRRRANCPIRYEADCVFVLEDQHSRETIEPLLQLYPQCAIKLVDAIDEAYVHIRQQVVMTN